MGLASYSASGAFLAALFENRESEFLQMAFYVVLTAFLFQRGSAESKDPDQQSPQDSDPTEDAKKADAPSLLRAGGLIRLSYEYSLGIVLAMLFVLSFILHWLASSQAANDEALLHHQAVQTAWQYLGSARFWFESFQNWQSEFLSTAVLVVLSIFLRFRGSPESKPVAAPHRQTGSG